MFVCFFVFLFFLSIFFLVSCVGSFFFLVFLFFVFAEALLPHVYCIILRMSAPFPESRTKAYYSDELLILYRRRNSLTRSPGIIQSQHSRQRYIDPPEYCPSNDKEWTAFYNGERRLEDSFSVIVGKFPSTNNQDTNNSKHSRQLKGSNVGSSFIHANGFSNPTSTLQTYEWLISQNN